MPLANDFLSNLQDFKTGKNVKMPILAFNKFYKSDDVVSAINNYKNENLKPEIKDIAGNYRKKELNIF